MPGGAPTIRRPRALGCLRKLGMLFLDETRMMSSNPEGLAQFENLVRRDRNHPSVIMWSMGNEERESATEAGLQHSYQHEEGSRRNRTVRAP